MSLYFLCRKLKYLNTFTRRKRIGSLIVTYFLSFLLFLLFLYDLCIVTITGNPDYSTHLIADYIPLFQMISCYTLLYSLISSWAVSNHLLLFFSSIAGVLVIVSMLARTALNLSLLGFYTETISKEYDLTFISDILKWITKYINAPN